MAIGGIQSGERTRRAKSNCSGPSATTACPSVACADPDRPASTHPAAIAHPCHGGTALDRYDPGVAQSFDIIREPDGTLVARLGSRGAVDINLSTGWSAHIISEIDREKPPRIVIDASNTNAVASAFFSGIIRIRDRSGLPREALILRCGSDRMREAARLLGMDQLISLER